MWHLIKDLACAMIMIMRQRRKLMEKLHKELPIGKAVQLKHLDKVSAYLHGKHGGMRFNLDASKLTSAVVVKHRLEDVGSSVVLDITYTSGKVQTVEVPRHFVKAIKWWSV